MSTIFQFKTTLKHTDPKIWRQIQVPGNYTFWDLHVAIQDAMGWTDTHLHAFIIPTHPGEAPVEIGIPEEDFPDDNLLAGWDIPLSKYVHSAGYSFGYDYDFGDDWSHDVVLEAVLNAEKGKKYPVCLDGAGACPPEDCGGPFGYRDLLQAFSDPSARDIQDPFLDEALEQLDKDFDPDRFDPGSVVFEDPARRLKRLGRQI